MRPIRLVRRKRSLATLSAVLFASAGTALFVGPQAHATGSGSSTQTLTFTPDVSAGLSITSSPLTGQLTPGSATSLNPVVVTDTEADSLQWTASVAATDCFPATSSVASAGILPANAITVNAGTGTSAATAPLSLTSVPATLGGSFSFTAPSSPGTLTTPNVSQAVTLASAAPSGSNALSNDGVYTLNPQVTVNDTGVSGFLAVPQLYTCQLQYTVTG